MAFKHVGRIISNKRKVIVAYRVVPGDPDNCLVIQTENLSADEHDSLIKAVESAAGQEANEFGEAMARVTLPDGRNMLAGFHTTGKLRKVPTELVEMTPTNNDTVQLSELNKIIAEQQGVTIADLAIKGPDGETVVPAVDSTETVDPTKVYTSSPEPATAKTDGVISDEDLAASYRSQADALFKEAKQLREQAEELVPTKRKSSKKTMESV
tara:strand:- start:6688 stop:7320 length:633 start_codon:yes stop_codon:yes gene_type:complete